MCAATGERQDRGPISDAHVAAALRPFVRATRPLLGALSDADPVGLQARSDRSRHDASAPHSVRGGRPAPDQGPAAVREAAPPAPPQIVPSGVDR